SPARRRRSRVAPVPPFFLFAVRLELPQTRRGLPGDLAPVREGVRVSKSAVARHCRVPLAHEYISPRSRPLSSVVHPRLSGCPPGFLACSVCSHLPSIVRALR